MMDPRDLAVGLFSSLHAGVAIRIPQLGRGGEPGLVR